MKKFLTLLFLAVFVVGALVYRAQADRPIPKTPLKGKVISDEEAQQIIDRFQKSAYGDNTHYVTFSKEHFQTILATPGVVDIRLSLAMKDQGSITLVVAGYDANGKRVTQNVEEPPICPPICNDPIQTP